MANWNTSKLGEMVKSGGGKIHTGPFGSQLHASDYVPSGIPCIMPANMVHNRVDLSGISFISEQDAARLSKYLVKGGDIVYSRRGDVTQKALIRDDEEGYFCGTGCLLLRPGSEIDPEFLTYYLSTASIKDWVVKQAVGATMPNLNTGILASVPFTAPMKKEQQKISSTISFIDKKIQLNNKINTELEAMAKLIYDYWFVQFDFPDANGKPYKSSGGNMVYNEVLKREIPEGWGVSSLNDLGVFKNGVNYDKSSFGDVSCPIINVRNISASSFFIRNNDLDSVMLSQREVDNYSMGCDDILIARSGIPGATRLVSNLDKNTIFCGFAIRYKLRNSMLKNKLFFDLKGLELIIQSGSGGTILKNVNQSTLKDLHFPYPEDVELLSRFNGVIGSLFKRINLLQDENLQLAELRDWLLPMLMNGQVTIKDSQSGSEAAN